jgi:hypothetical protein
MCVEVEYGIQLLVLHTSRVLASSKYLHSSNLLWPHHTYQHLITPWSEPVSELYRRSNRCLSEKLVTTFADRGCHVSA